jgi:hypothetical protein
MHLSCAASYLEIEYSSELEKISRCCVMTIVEEYKHYNSELNFKLYVGQMVAIAVAPRLSYFLDSWPSTINKTIPPYFANMMNTQNQASSRWRLSFAVRGPRTG